MTLLVVAHGTQAADGVATAVDLVDAVAARLPGVPVRLAFADVCGPFVRDVLAELDGPVVVVPAFLAAGYHVRVDLPAQLIGRADVRLTAPLGAAPGMVAAAADRLIRAGLRPSDTVVLAAAGSSDPRARADVREAADRLGMVLGQSVGVAHIGPSVRDIVERTRGRVAVASWLLAPGLFHRSLGQVGADVLSAPLGAHPLVVDTVVRRYESNRLGGSFFAASMASVASDQR